MIRYDLTKYLTHGATAFLGLSAYDVLVDGRRFDNYVVKDGATFALSSISSLWFTDLLADVWAGMSRESIQGMLAKPLINAALYMYLYNYMVRQNYENNRSNNENFVMAGIGDVLLKWIENPIASLFGYRNY